MTKDPRSSHLKGKTEQRLNQKRPGAPSGSGISSCPAWALRGPDGLGETDWI